MSRHTFAGKAGTTVAIGWDRPLRTFFVQVSKPHPTKAGENKMLRWAGTSVIQQPEQLRAGKASATLMFDIAGRDTEPLCSGERV